MIEKHIHSLKALSKEIQSYPINPDNAHTYKKKFLSKTGSLQALFHTLPTLPPQQRKSIGQELNKLKQIAKQRYQKAHQAPTTHTTTTPPQETTLPPPQMQRGSLHILTQVQQHVIRILESIGFRIVQGPEIENEWYNFSALNFPPQHPARDMQDTFFIANKQGEKMSLRTQTSCVQIRIMEKQQPPIRIASLGRVFRKETISARSHCTFHQIEGLYVNKNVSFIDLKDTLHYFVRSLFGKETTMRLRPSYFPFTEPSAELDIQCILCQGKGCTVCKKSGWLEIGGAGMVDPNVFINCHISPETYTGYAFGIGIERIAMLLARIPDVRLFMENDLRFLQQFAISTIA